MFANTGIDLLSLDIMSPTIEAVTLNAISGILAQLLTAYKAQDLFEVDFAQILQFMLFTAIVAAPNFVFQTVLEKHFPTRTLPKLGLKQTHAKDRNNDEDLLRKYGRLNISNTIIKFCLDQSLGATANTVLFVVLLGLIRGQGLDYICAALSTEFWPMLLAGYRFWPVVCLLNLVLVPMEYRPFVGNGAGLVWGVVVSLW